MSRCKVVMIMDCDMEGAWTPEFVRDNAPDILEGKCITDGNDSYAFSNVTVYKSLEDFDLDRAERLDHFAEGRVHTFMTYGPANRLYLAAKAQSAASASPQLLEALRDCDKAITERQRLARFIGRAREQANDDLEIDDYPVTSKLDVAKAALRALRQATLCAQDYWASTRHAEDIWNAVEAADTVLAKRGPA